MRQYFGLLCRWQHHLSRKKGYLEFYRRTCNLRRLPFFIVSFGRSFKHFLKAYHCNSHSCYFCFNFFPCSFPLSERWNCQNSIYIFRCEQHNSFYELVYQWRWSNVSVFIIVLTKILYISWLILFLVNINKVERKLK